MEMKKTDWCVYWIHWTDNEDIRSQGYVGVTNDPKRRWSKHKRTENWRLHKCILSGGVMTVLHEGLTAEEALVIERELRPEEHIGLNIAPGGGAPFWQAGHRTLKRKWDSDDEWQAKWRAKHLESVNTAEEKKARSERAKKLHAAGKLGNKGSKHRRIDCPDCGKSVSIACMWRHKCP